MKICDNTIRDGEQMPGVVFASREKQILIKKFLQFGVDIIDIMPSISYDELKLTEYLIDDGYVDYIYASTLCRKKDIDLAHKLGLKNIFLFTSISDIHLDKKLHISREKNIENSMKFVDYAKEQGLNVSFAGEDASRADEKYLIKFINKLKDNLDYFILCDTLGVLNPFYTHYFIKRLKEKTDSKIGIHCHNDFGQATANTLAGIIAGADLFSGTFNGIGERGGNAPIEEVIMALKYQFNKELPLKYNMINEICSLVEKYSNVKLQKHKPISGENAFSHESGTHVDGILKFKGNYENFPPEVIGRKTKIIYGKHSGKSGLRYLFGDKFISSQYETILQKIKEISHLEKKIFSEEEIRNMFDG